MANEDQQQNSAPLSDSAAPPIPVKPDYSKQQLPDPQQPDDVKPQQDPFADGKTVTPVPTKPAEPEQKSPDQDGPLYYMPPRQQDPFAPPQPNGQTSQTPAQPAITPPPVPPHNGTVSSYTVDEKTELNGPLSVEAFKETEFYKNLPAKQQAELQKQFDEIEVNSDPNLPTRVVIQSNRDDRGNYTPEMVHIGTYIPSSQSLDHGIAISERIFYPDTGKIVAPQEPPSLALTQSSGDHPSIEQASEFVARLQELMRDGRLPDTPSQRTTEMDAYRSQHQLESILKPAPSGKEPLSVQPGAPAKPEAYQLDITPPSPLRSGNMNYSFDIRPNEQGQLELTFSQDLGGQPMGEVKRILPDLQLSDLDKYKTIELTANGQVVGRIDTSDLRVVCEVSKRSPLVEAFAYGVDITRGVDHSLDEYQKRKENDPKLPEIPQDMPHVRPFRDYIIDPEKFDRMEEQQQQELEQEKKPAGMLVKGSNPHFDELLAKGPKPEAPDKDVSLASLPAPTNTPKLATATGKVTSIT